jgi:hypothetical protein
VKAGVFPRRRESSPSAAYFEELAELISALDGATAPWTLQMTPPPGGGYSSSGMMHPTSLRREFCPRRIVFCISYPKNVKAEIGASKRRKGLDFHLEMEA